MFFFQSFVRLGDAFHDRRLAKQRQSDISFCWLPSFHMLPRRLQLVVLLLSPLLFCFASGLGGAHEQESCRIDPPVTSATRVDPDERVQG